MSKTAQIRGVVAQINWSYYTAAGVHGYTAKRNKAANTWSLTAMVVVSDAFKMSQRPLVFVAPYVNKGKEEKWRWEIESLDRSRLVNGRGPVSATAFLI